MEYLDSIRSPLKKVNEKNIQYLDLFKHPSLVFGITDESDKLNFCKYSKEVQKEISESYPELNHIFQYHKTSNCGCRIKFKTNSKKLVFKIKLKRGFNYKNIVMWNSSALTVYLVDDGKYKFHKLIAPLAGNQCFSESINIPANSSICIFLPNFDTIEQMYIGFEQGSKVKKFNYPKNKRNPVIFYGGSVAQGASATKSGNSYPNIVSKKLNRDIINLSVTDCCKATPAIADMIADIECDSIVLDYSMDATNKEELEDKHEKFYKKIRAYHKDKKIILLTTGFNNSKKYDTYDDIIVNTYENAKSRGENTFLINQKDLFDEGDYEVISLDNGCYTDYAMFKLADKICELLIS